jgi:hypothetical protein
MAAESAVTPAGIEPAYFPASVVAMIVRPLSIVALASDTGDAG